MTSVTHLPTQNILVKDLRVANGFFSRLKGLMFTASLDQGKGLIITPCQQVHTHFMRYPLDIIFLDAQHTVIDTILGMKPWRFSKYYKNARYVLELPYGTATTIGIGDTLAFSKQID